MKTEKDKCLFIYFYKNICCLIESYNLKGKIDKKNKLINHVHILQCYFYYP